MRPAAIEVAHFDEMIHELREVFETAPVGVNLLLGAVNRDCRLDIYAATPTKVRACVAAGSVAPDSCADRAEPGGSAAEQREPRYPKRSVSLLITSRGEGRTNH